MLYTSAQIANITTGTLYGDSNNSCAGVLTDSRVLVNTANLMFVALVGKRNDGHVFISKLHQSGVQLFLVSELPENYKELKDANFILVPNTLLALQKLAKHHRQSVSIPIIGITGSNGKTICKEWLYQLLSPDLNICRSPKSFNSQLGVPLSVLQLEPSHEIGIFEAGISQPNEMASLQKIIQPNYGILTNIGSSHDSGFKTPLEKTTEKLKLFLTSEKIIYCSDNEIVNEALVKLNYSPDKLFSWSFKNNSAHFFISKTLSGTNQTSITGNFKGSEKTITIPFYDNASIENAINCWSALLLLNIPDHTIQKRMLHLSSVDMRLEQKQGVNNCVIVNDSYNSDLVSLAIALDFANQIPQHKNKTLILSDIAQTGKKPEVLYEEVAKMLEHKGFNKIIGVGKEILQEKNSFKRFDGLFFETTNELIKNLFSLQLHNQTILIKGAREFKFEQLIELLQEKSHDTVLEINLNTLINNFNYFKEKLNPETKIMAMVKASSYGSGGTEIASMLEHHKVNYLAVAYSDEGVALRKSGIKSPIMVMSPEEQGFSDLINYQLEPEVFSLRMFKLINDFTQTTSTDKIKIHIKLDTGMNRLGISAEEIPELVSLLSKSKHVQVASIFSHLAASDDDSFDDFSLKQIAEFDKGSNEIIEALDYSVLRHLCNSAAIHRFPQAHFDMVRLGIGLYGLGSNEESQRELESISKLKTKISQIKTLFEGDTVGYSRRGKILHQTNVATLPIGYADGVSRKMGNGAGTFFVNGKACKTIGSICMDMCMIDVTDVSCNEGDQAVLFENIKQIKNIADICETIPYEILTNVSSRVKRIYVQE